MAGFAQSLRHRSLRHWGLRALWRALVLASLAGPVSPAGAVTRGYIVTDFDTIRMEGPVRVVLDTGGGATASGTGDGAMLDRVDLSVSGRELTVRMKDAGESGFAPARPGAAPVVTLSTSRLRRVVMMGGGVLTIGTLAGQDVVLAMNGNGEVRVQAAAVERLSLFLSGGGRMMLKGRAGVVKAMVNGPGTLDAAALDARDATIANDGPGTVSLSVHGPVTVTSTGSGDTVVGGKPVCTVRQQGVGQVSCGEGASGGS